MNNAEILVTFKGDTKDLDKKTSNAKSSVNGFAKVVGAGLGGALGVATTALIGLTTGLVNLTKASVDAYSEFEQLEGGLESLFGKGSEEMNSILKTSEDAYRTLTMSQNQYLTAFEGSYSLIKNGMADESKAIEYTNTVLQLSADLFNTYGKSTEYYQNAIDWALKGTFSYLDNLSIGIKGTAEGFVEAANKSGILERNIKNVKELTNEEIVDVIKHYAIEAGAWERTQTEASNTVIGSLNMVKATWQNFILGLSKKDTDIGPLIDQLVQSAMTFLDQIVPVIIRAVEGIANALPLLATKIGNKLPNLMEKLLPKLISAIINLVHSVVQNLPKIIDILFDAIVDISIEATKMLPEILNAILVATITIIEGLCDALPTMLPLIVEAILGIIPVLIDNTPLFIKCGIEILMAFLQGIVMMVPQLLSSVWDIIQHIIASFLNLPNTIKTVGGDLINGLWNGIKDKSQWVINKIKSLGSSILKAVKGIFGIHSPSTEFAYIGKMNITGLEQGMENMQPELQKTLNGMFDLQPNISGTMSNSLSPNLNVVVNNNMEVDPIGQVVNKIKTFSGGAKNDYNWGATQ